MASLILSIVLICILSTIGIFAFLDCFEQEDLTPHQVARGILMVAALFITAGLIGKSYTTLEDKRLEDAKSKQDKGTTPVSAKELVDAGAELPEKEKLQ